MRVVGREKLELFAVRHADVRSQIDAWLWEVMEADWESSVDVKSRYRTASFLAENRVVFNLRGNKYRLVAKISYTAQVVFVERVGTHAEYSRWTL